MPDCVRNLSGTVFLYELLAKIVACLQRLTSLYYYYYLHIN